MTQQLKVFVLVLSGREQDALTFSQDRYPGRDTVVLSKSELRESGWLRQLYQLRQLKGEALLIFSDSLKTLREPTLLQWTVLVHRCRETVLADSSGSFIVTRKAGILGVLQRSFIAALADAFVFAFVGVGLRLFHLWLKVGGQPEARNGQIDLAFLFPSQGGLGVPGGARTHVTGFLSGLAQEGARAEVFTGQPLETSCPVRQIPAFRFPHLFREAASLSYNLRFIVVAGRLLARRKPRLLYQRHGSFLFAGALLSRLLRIPLVLEYNGSEDWIAKHWDPARFSSWLRLCEKVSIEAASVLAVVSHPLKEELMKAGIPAERILVNPNGVDPEWFHPDCGGAELRQKLGFRPEDIVVGFVSTFSYYHGVAVLEDAIRMLLDGASHTGPHLKFLLVGDGLLAPQLRSTFEPRVREGLVTFTGSVPHGAVRAYLDAADILVSPHIPMPGGVPFFGSPTKLFEYMAMGKAIAASALDQIAEVLENGNTALLVKPGAAGELAEAIRRLSADAQLRRNLGANARRAVLTCHTWRQNAGRVLTCFSEDRQAEFKSLGNPAAASYSSSGSERLAKQDL